MFMINPKLYLCLHFMLVVIFLTCYFKITLEKDNSQVEFSEKKIHYCRLNIDYLYRIILSLSAIGLFY